MNLCSILVVEDHADSAAMLERLLSRMGHTVAIAGCVRDAEALAALTRFDVLISDVGLPDGDGYALFRSVRAMYPVKGIAVTGYGAADDAAACRRAGFDAHLVKPVMFDQLKAALDALCNGGRPR
jgi:CheY-like chemotaxis protein